MTQAPMPPAPPPMAPAPPPMAQPPKKRHILRNGFLSVVALFIVLGVIGAMTNSGTKKAADTTQTATSGQTTTDQNASTPSTPPKAEAAPKAKAAPKGLDPTAGHPNVVKVGTSFVLGDFKVLKGWRLVNVGFGLGYEVKGLTVKNITGGSHSFLTDVKLHRGAHRIVADITCISDPAGPGDIVDVNCLPDGRGGPYGRVTIENSI